MDVGQYEKGVVALLQEEIIKFKDDKLTLSKEQVLMFKNLFSGCRINFLLGAGFSCGILGLLKSYEDFMESLRIYECASDDERRKKTILTAYAYWGYFIDCIYPIVDKIVSGTPEFDALCQFGRVIYKILQNRSTPTLNHQVNIFTTNYDPLLEVVFDENKNILYNDGFEGRIAPYFATDNFCRSVYRQSAYSEKKVEIPLVNILKLHGSITWKRVLPDESIGYAYYKQTLASFYKKYSAVFKDDIIHEMNDLTAPFNTTKLKVFIESDTLKAEIPSVANYCDMIDDYQNNMLIVNPTKEKFSATLMNKNYHDLLRIYSNELEKDNAVMFVFGYSFNDEHILEITRRSSFNPALQICIICYNSDAANDYRLLFKGSKSHNVRLFVPENSKTIDLSFFTKMLCSVLTGGNDE